MATTTAPRKARPRKTVSAMATMPVSNTPAARKARGETVAPAPKAAAAKTATKAATWPSGMTTSEIKATTKPRKAAAPKAKPAPVPFVEAVPMTRCQEITKHERKTYKCDDLDGPEHQHYAWINDATMLTWGVR